MTTERQKAAVQFCEQWLYVTFDGNIEDESEVQNFLAEYFNEAEMLYNEVRCEYESYLYI